MTVQITDWRVDLNGKNAIVFPGACPPKDPEAAAEGERIVSWLIEHKDARPQFGFEVDGVRYRAQALSEGVYTLRRIRPIPYALGELGLHPLTATALMDPRLEEGGLILISGPTGSGKTTTLVASLRERLVKYGGYCLAIEDPVEYLIAGPYGNAGYCDQIEAEGPEDYCKRTMRAVRCFPAKTRGILFLGEIRDEVTAIEAVRASLAGFLVFSTIHSFGIISSIQRMLALMGGESAESLRSMLSDAIRLLIFQRWGGGHDGGPSITHLPTSDKVKGAIKNGKLDALKDDIHQIMNQMQKR